MTVDDEWGTVGEDLKLMSDDELANGLEHIARGLMAESGDVATALARLVVTEAIRRLRQ